MDISKDKLIEGWQHEYDAAVKGGGVVLDVITEVGRFGGLAIWIKVKKSGKNAVYHSPYFEQTPSDEDLAAVEENADAWAWMMLGATDWSEYDWGNPETRIPAY